MLIGDISRNNLFSLPLNDYYIGYVSLFKFKGVPENVALAIVENAEASERLVELIRAYIKD